MIRPSLQPLTALGVIVVQIARSLNPPFLNAQGPPQPPLLRQPKKRQPRTNGAAHVVWRPVRNAIEPGLVGFKAGAASKCCSSHG